VVAPATGDIALARFPFSDLSQSRLRPALVLAESGRGDWVLCQITSNPYSDPDAVEISINDVSAGSLQRTSYARPGKLFTANTNLMVSVSGALNYEILRSVVERVVSLVSTGLHE